MGKTDTFQKLVTILKERHKTIACAESCTAGLFASSIAEIPGASDVLEFGFVAYSVRAKHEVLNVSYETVENFGVVSEETALAMAAGAARAAKADVAVGITGFAGPSAEDGFPVGRVCFGFYVDGEAQSQTVEFGDIGRNPVREKSAIHAAQRLLEILEKQKQ